MQPIKIIFAEPVSEIVGRALYLQLPSISADHHQVPEDILCFCRHNIVSFVLFLISILPFFSPFVHESLSKSDVYNLSGDVPW